MVIYLSDLESSLKKRLGHYQGEDVYIIGNSQVEMNALDEERFYGKCIVSSRNGNMDRYYIGHLFVSGTALIL